MRIHTFWTFVAAAITGCFLLVAQAFAGGVNVDGNGIAIKGHDPVAYFTVGAPKPGKNAFTSTHKGATYKFASADNKALFDANPAKYAPAYGGYCAYGVAQGYKVKIEPDQFKIVGGTLYLNYDARVQSTWKKDIPGYIKTADKKWPTL